MASTSALPQRPRATNNPPTSIPSQKARKSLPVPSGGSRVPSPTPSKLRTPASPRPQLAKSSQSSSTTDIPSLRSTSAGRTPSSPDKTLRRTISIAAFPQPPKAGSTRPSPSSSFSGIPPKSATPDLKSSASSITSKSKKLSRLSTGTTSSYRSSKTPSLLGLGAASVDPEGQFNIPSPPQSRSSSAQGSYSTSATTFDDADEAGGNSKGTGKAKDAKGNVLVSVRVRPDAGNSDASKPDGEWMVDGRRALISFRGKEAGDYYYGKGQSNPINIPLLSGELS